MRLVNHIWNTNENTKVVFKKYLSLKVSAVVYVVQNTVAGVTKFFVMSLGDMAGSSFRLDNDNGRVYKRVESS